MPEDRKEFLIFLGKNIKSLREQKQITLDELAKKCGYNSENSRSTIQKIESGKNDIPASKLKAIATALGTTPTYLMGLEESQDKASQIKVTTHQPKILHYYEQLNDIGKHEAEKRVSELTYIDKYTTNSGLRAAHNDFADNDEEIEKIRRDFDKF